MRRGVAVLLTLFFLPMPVLAEEVDTELLNDDAGDVVVTSADGSLSQSDGGRFQDVDLTSVGILAEDDATITFYVEVASLTESSQNPLPFSDPDYRIYFDFGGQGYRVRADLALQNPFNDQMSRSNTVYAVLENQVTETQYRAVADAEAELDTGANRVTVTVPRGAIVDENQAGLGRNRTIENIWASARSMGYFQFPVGQTQQGGDPVAYAGIPAAWDQVPDDKAGLPSYTMVTGELKQRGSIFAGSEDPVRWTNGEASTLSYTVTLSNTADEDLDVGVGVAEQDPQWTVAYTDLVTVPAKDTANVTFLITIPFSHNHGKVHMFEARFKSLDERHVAAADLGVYWPEVPQPAGHHDKLWFHSLQEESDGGFFSAFDNGMHAWFSAKEDEDLDEGISIPSQFTMPPNTFTGGKALAFWSIDLEPGLRMGMDFRPEDLGSAEITLEFPSPVMDPHLTYRVRYVETDPTSFGGRGGNQRETSTTLVTGEASVAGQASSTQTFPLELTVDAAADRLPYTANTNLAIDIIVDATFMAGFGNGDPAGIAPKLSTSQSWMQWPLDEYDEGVDLTFATDGSLEISVGPEGQQRLVNAGRTVIYTFDVAYHGSLSSVFDAKLTGTNVEWAEIVGDARFGIEGHETRTVGVAVTAPKGASNGERADLTLTIIDVDNAAVQAGINLVTTVDSRTDIPDESVRKEDLDAQLTEDKESPGLPLVALLGALVVVLRRRD